MSLLTQPTTLITNNYNADCHHSVWNQSEPSTIEICETIRDTLISECTRFLSSFETFNLKHVYLNELYDPSKLPPFTSSSWMNLNSKRNSKCQPSVTNFQIQKTSSCHIISETELDHWPSFRMAVVGCSERSIHSAMVQTFSKDSFPIDYISNYGQSFRCGIHLTTTTETSNVPSSPTSIHNHHSTTNNSLQHSPSSNSNHATNHSFISQNGNSNYEKLTCLQLKLVDMPTDVWEFPHESNVYLKSSDCVAVFFNVRYESSFTQVQQVIIPTIQKYSPLAKIIVIGIDWLSMFLKEEQYESLKYKLSSQELIQLEPISSDRVIEECCSKKSQVMGYIQFTPQDASRDVLNLMDVILKLGIGCSRHVNANLFPNGNCHLSRSVRTFHQPNSPFSSNTYKITTLPTTLPPSIPSGSHPIKKSLSLYGFFKKKKVEDHDDFTPLKSFKKFLSRKPSLR
nr:unnamed protein product [Naegleria fowleri]